MDSRFVVFTKDELKKIVKNYGTSLFAKIKKKQDDDKKEFQGVQRKI